MNNIFLERANSFSPTLYSEKLSPVYTAAFENNKTYYQGVKAVASPLQNRIFGEGDSICLDFSRHITGYFSFVLEQNDKYLDAPVKFEIKFAETPYEMYREFDSYSGSLCSSWLQEEIITADIKGRVSLSRRFSFRYVRIKILATPHSVILKDFSAEAFSSADRSRPAVLPHDTCDLFKKIDKISLATLSECMQDVFEDGPKRDRRLWIGDLRLQALANYYTFNNTDIVKRCLYLFAAFDCENSLLPSYLYTRPTLETGDAYLVSYALLYTVTLCDYFEHTGDSGTAEELFETAKRQLDLTEKMLDEKGILTMPENYGWWAFIDWSEVEPVTSLMGIFMYTAEKFKNLCTALNKPELASYYDGLLQNLRKASSAHLYNSSEGLFVNEYDKNQYSVAAQVWMILGGVTDKSAAQHILGEIINNDKYLPPVTPYMHHYVVEALIKSDMSDEATDYIKDYWGTMADYGADTFWEVFVKTDHFASPYGDALINSACHAWSCTPTYFIRKYGLK